MKRTTMITGATSGIGEACALVFAQQGDNLIITGRRKERLEALAATLKADFGIGVKALNFDVRVKKQVDDAVDSLQGQWKEIDILVNNAGLAVGLSHIDEADTDDWERMIDTNIKGLLYVTRAVSPLMVKRNRGHIINIGSIAGKEIYEYGNVYCGTKHAVDAISRGMRIDLLKHNIKVTNVAPGLVTTEFSIVRFKGDEAKAEIPYKGLDPLTAPDIAGVVSFCANLPAHVNINDITVMPTAQASANHYHRI